jgi:ubiquinone/menaquinone biosynthesis C-methylase UbiE
MTGSSGSNTYLLGSETSTIQRYRLFNEIYLPGTLLRFSDISISPDMEILEIGCGIGDTACHFAQNLVPNGHVTGFDQAPDLIELANERATELGIENVTFVCARAQNFPFPSERFDLAHTRYVLSYLSDAGDILRKTFSALKPSGTFLGEEIAQIYIHHGNTQWYEQMTSCDRNRRR